MLLDSYDKAIITILQKNARITNQDLADQVSLSAAPCWRRVKRLEETGVIQHYVALLNPAKIALNTLAYIEVSLTDHTEATMSGFDEFIDSTPEVLECYSVSGQYDYLLRVLVKDNLTLESFLMKKLLRRNIVKASNTFFALNQKKYTTQLVPQD
ncbi:Lrp/AsnC family transcriptional regulator [Leucothrix pacifica]|uniref:Lrp/AsnC family transcriptional regulator n=1 Tax=Leucothrix pacifica TaxID=1247513 RepID=A0A317C5E3_9GAMM|nr:Lrp/AsnC family transcriptional regulator [Leucothrix pacifica]